MSDVEQLNQKFIGGVIMDVVTPEQAKIAEDAGASAVMALERVPSDIRAQGGVARMSDPDLIEGIIDAVDIPVMAKARIGHYMEAKILEHLGVDYIDESEVLSPADYVNHIDKTDFTVPFVCACGSCADCAAGDQQVCARQTQPGFTHWGSFARYVALEHADVDPTARGEVLAVTDFARVAEGLALARAAVPSTRPADPQPEPQPDPQADPATTEEPPA